MIFTCKTGCQGTQKEEARDFSPLKVGGLSYILNIVRFVGSINEMQ